MDQNPTWAAKCITVSILCSVSRWPIRSALWMSPLTSCMNSKNQPIPGYKGCCQHLLCEGL